MQLVKIRDPKPTPQREQHRSRDPVLIPTPSPQTRGTREGEPGKQLPMHQWPSKPPQESVKILSPAIVIPPNIWKITGALAAAHHPRPPPSLLPVPGRQGCDVRMQGLGWDAWVSPARSRWLWTLNPFCLHLPTSPPASGQVLAPGKAGQGIVKPARWVKILP